MGRDGAHHQGAWRVAHPEGCSYPLTAKGVVKRVYTDLAVLEVTPRGFAVLDMVPGMTREVLQARSEAELHLGMIARHRNQRRESRSSAARRSAAWARMNGSMASRQGTLDPGASANRSIALLDQAPRNADGLVEYRSDFVLLRPADAAKGNGRLLYEVNNRGRIMMFANLCAGAAGNQPATAADLGNALPSAAGFFAVVDGLGPGAPKADRAVAGCAGDRGPHPADPRRIRLRHAPRRARGVQAGVRGRRAADGHRAPHPDGTTHRGRVPRWWTEVRCARWAGIETGSIYEVRYQATRPRVLGIGFAATRDIVSHIRVAWRGSSPGARSSTRWRSGFPRPVVTCEITSRKASTRDEDGRRCSTACFTHVAGIGRVFLNTPFAQPFRTRTWHEDHDFPEVEFPHSSAAMHDPVTGRTGGLMRGDATDPKLIETNTATEYWQKGASLLHTDPLGTQDVALPPNVRATCCRHAAWRQGGDAAGQWALRVPAQLARSDAGDPRAAGGVDEWVTSGREPPGSCLPRIDDGTLVPAEKVAFPAIPGLVHPHAPTMPRRWPTGPIQGRMGIATSRWCLRWMPTATNRAGIRLPDIAVPRGTFTGWNLYAAPYPAGELADRDGAFLAFAETEAERGDDPRPSLAARYPDESSYRSKVKQVAEALLARRLLLAEDAESFLTQGKHG